MKAKRIVSILLTGSMLLSLLPVSALAAAPVFENRGLISSGTYSQPDRKSTRLNSSHPLSSRMPSSA